MPTPTGPAWRICPWETCRGGHAGHLLESDLVPGKIPPPSWKPPPVPTLNGHQAWLLERIEHYDRDCLGMLVSVQVRAEPDLIDHFQKGSSQSYLLHQGIVVYFQKDTTAGLGEHAYHMTTLVDADRDEAEHGGTFGLAFATPSSAALCDIWWGLLPENSFGHSLEIARALCLE